MQKSTFLLLVLLLLQTSFLLAAPSEDEIKSLPGLREQPQFMQYSGYLYATGERRLHYWFVESAGNPRLDPVAVWLNGGPGCSSLFGLLSENGPFRVKEDGVTLEPNPFSWNNVANMLYIESPAGVGFSYASDGNYTTDDDLTAEQNYAAVKDFFGKFPEFLNNELFITGESYGGIYVPMLSVLLMDDPSFNLKGYAVGNGVSNREMMGSSIVYFAYYHGLVGTTEWNSLITDCCGGVERMCNFVRGAQQSKSCDQQVRKVQQTIDGGTFDAYNLYGPCADGVASPFVAHKRLLNWAFQSLPGRKEPHDQLTRPLAEHSCTNNTAVTSYLNQPEVRQALHIPESVQKWINCVGYQEGWYTEIYNDTTPFYRRLFKGNIRGILYNGDVDMVCNFLGDEWFAESLRRPVREERRMWFYRDEKGLKQVAGFVKTFDILTSLTVRGSGHMVPMDRPRPAFEVIRNLVQNTPF